MHRVSAILFALLVFGWSSSASAQLFADAENPDDNQVLFVSSTTTTSTALGVAMIVATVVSAVPDDESAHVERYLRENAVALRGDLTLGGGETVDDLATLLRIPDEHRATFGQAMRSESARLVALADPEKLNLVRAGAFVRLARGAWETRRRAELDAT